MTFGTVSSEELMDVDATAVARHEPKMSRSLAIKDGSFDTT